MTCEDQALVPTSVCLKWGCEKAELVLEESTGFWRCPVCNGSYGKFAKEGLEKPSCDKCDDCGGEVTYANQVSMAINGKVRTIDWCIHRIVAALNAGGIPTAACCCGHGKQDGIITLDDGRDLIIKAKGGE